MTSPNAQQKDFWSSSPAGAKWLRFEDDLDTALAPVLDLVLERADLRPGMRVLDIGCGTGASLLAIADRVGADGHVTGIDISQPFLDRAMERARAHGAAQINTLNTDAQTHDFKSESADAITSRFGVMFFEDSGAAFANMARALAPGAVMTFAAWGPLDGNPWFRDPFIAAVNRLGRPPKTDRNAPGPMAFHDLDRVLGLLHAAGLDATGEPVSLHLTPAGGPEGAARMCTNVGAVSRVMEHFNGTKDDADAIRDSITDTFRAYDTPDGVRMPAVINLYQARWPG
ncbi:MAG: class I SAM-dependent methyltransferase [Marinibacterium sp.]|nr:class I SAM-dependent methyltransferase [Marinibacterium sp.]